MSVIQMTCVRDYTLRTKLGHTIKFEAGKPTAVPESAYAEAIAKNIVPVKRPKGEEPAFGLIHAEITGTLRDALIYETLDQLVKRNDSGDFTGGGVPKAAAVSAEIGISISASEIGKYWTNYREMVAQNDELPTHPNVETVRELQALTTRKQMTEFAEEHDITIPAAKGKSLKEVKAQLLHQIVSQQVTPAAPDEDYVRPSTLMED